MRETRLRKTTVIVLGAVLYALLYGFCSQIDRTGHADVMEAGRRFLVALPAALMILTGLFAAVLPFLERKLKSSPKTEKPFCTVGAFALIFLFYVPMFLIEFPGSFTYNTQDQTVQAATGMYTTFHPLIHTLMLKACLSTYDFFQSYEKCAALYSIIQMLVLSGCFALICASLSRSTTRRTAHLAVIFFCLYPLHWVLASNCTKDVLFSGFFALFLAYALEAVRAEKLPAGRVMMQAATGIMACLFRNNMIYAMAVWLVFMIIWQARRHIQLIVCTALAMVLAVCANNGLKAATNAAEGKVVEMLSVPIQQLAYARLKADDRFTDEERELMDSIFVDECYRYYEPTLSDPVKDRVDDAAMREHMAEMAKLWFSVALKCPNEYLDAFLNLTLPSLYPYRQYGVIAPYLEAGTNGGVITEIFGQPPIVQPARFAGIREFLTEQFLNTGADHVPIVRELFNTGSIFWLLLLLFLNSVYRGDKKHTLILLLPVLLWGTFLLGPVMQGRYLYPFICSLPVFAACAKEEK